MFVAIDYQLMSTLHTSVTKSVEQRKKENTFVCANVERGRHARAASEWKDSYEKCNYKTQKFVRMDGRGRT